MKINREIYYVDEKFKTDKRFWIVKFETDYITEHYIFRLKPTKKQVRASRKVFNKLNKWMKEEYGG
ncbi:MULTISPECIES: hypothetical protein [Arsenophonus]|uniref:hypothetical protein n=1 Tax=Arsenophonus TaxID=637 RepID=UPI0015D7F9B9|nr:MULTISPECIES: hypothetical protein [Arsenophonus]UBX30210.1 hypothetical protein LDL57_06295 [Arsenophonus apicola]